MCKYSILKLKIPKEYLCCVTITITTLLCYLFALHNNMNLLSWMYDLLLLLQCNIKPFYCKITLHTCLLLLWGNTLPSLRPIDRFFIPAFEFEDHSSIFLTVLRDEGFYIASVVVHSVVCWCQYINFDEVSMCMFVCTFDLLQRTQMMELS